MKVNAKPLSELSRLEQCLKVASTPFKSAPQQIISMMIMMNPAPLYYRPALLKSIAVQTSC